MMKPMHGIEKAIGKTIERMESGTSGDDSSTIRLAIHFTDGTKFSFIVDTKAWVKFEDGTKKDSVNVQWMVKDAQVS
jgi:hypothetical protein